ncbi:hypothetical protein [Paenirhodobacter populi]|uniref:hypothetical protein n=1 Tax=Paenirhodobacter populi TaxID=2306993 RepID=UPI000FE348DF|nr:hypothetical protein [Sinirhodobacter populi]RWR06168.1 hypothetical protein D2T32_14525 [Sinirhodobacter populi]
MGHLLPPLHRCQHGDGFGPVGAGPEDKQAVMVDVSEREGREEASDDMKYAIKYRDADVKKLIAETDHPGFRPMRWAPRNRPG